MNIRIKWLRDQLKSMELDGMIVSNPINVKYLTGLDEEGTFIIAPKENVFLTDSRYIESVNNKLTIDDEIIAYDIKNMSKYDYEAFFMCCHDIGFEEKYVTYETYKKYLQTYQVNLVETEGIIENHRIVKDEEEIALIQQACEITDSAFEYAKKILRYGMTEKELKFEIERFMMENGADGVAFDSIVAFGENTSMPHAVPTNRKLQSGDIIQFDIGAKYHGYCADFSRVVFADYMKNEYEDSYNFVLEEQQRIVDSFKNGVNIKQVMKDRESDYHLKNFSVMHSFGHGVGMDLHEEPFLNAKMDVYLKENSVVAIEPGVYKAGRFGIRIEDTYRITKDSCINLTKSGKNVTIIDIKDKKTLDL